MGVPRRHRADGAEQPARVPPCRAGDRVRLIGPDGTCYLVRVEWIVSCGNGEFTLIAAVISPRQLRSHLITTMVDTNGVAADLTPAPPKPRLSHD